jgi:hypothetical protein
VLCDDLIADKMLPALYDGLDKALTKIAKA